MKLKELMDAKTIELMLKSDKEKMDALKEDLISQGLQDHIIEGNDGAMTIDGLRWAEIKPYAIGAIAKEALNYLRDTDPAYYRAVSSEIIKKKGEAEIDIDLLLKKIPELSALKELVKLYS